MSLKEIGINTRNYVDSTQDSILCECGNIPQDFISHGVCYLVQVYLFTICIFTNVIRLIKSRRQSWGGHVVTKGEGKSGFKILTRSSTNKRFLRSLRMEDNIKSYIK